MSGGQTETQNLIAGQFEIDALVLINQFEEAVDIRSMCSSLQIFEDIEKKFLTGAAVIIDGLDYLKNFRMTGQEFLRVAFRQKEGMNKSSETQFSIDKTFRVYKVKNIQNNPDGLGIGYQLIFCDPREFYAKRTRVSQVYRGSWSNILQNILLNDANFKEEEFDHWEDTEYENFQFISPNWTVMDIIDYIEKQGTPSDNTWGNEMFFFQTANGKFQFKSFSEMCQSEFPVEFDDVSRSDYDASIRDLNGKGGLNSEIKEFMREQQFDTLKLTETGGYASTMKVFDPMRKIQYNQVFDLKKVYDKGHHVSGHPLSVLDQDEVWLTSDNLTGATENITVTQYDVDSAPNEQDGSLIVHDIHSRHSFDNGQIDQDEEWRGRQNLDDKRLRRNALMQVLKQYSVRVKIPFRTDLSVGHVIILKQQPKDIQGRQVSPDKLNDNRYIITKIGYNCSPVEEVGMLNLECVKESYAGIVKDIPSPLLTASGPEEGSAIRR